MNLYRSLGEGPYETWQVEITHSEKPYANVLCVPKSLAPTPEDAVAFVANSR